MDVKNRDSWSLNKFRNEYEEQRGMFHNWSHLNIKNTIDHKDQQQRNPQLITYEHQQQKSDDG